MFLDVLMGVSTCLEYLALRIRIQQVISNQDVDFFSCHICVVSMEE